MDEFAGRLKAQDILKVIKACADHGVKEFRFGELEFKLGTRDNELGQAANASFYGHIAQHDKEEELEITPDMEAEIHEQRWEETLIADPLAHEELTLKVLDGEELS